MTTHEAHVGAMSGTAPTPHSATSTPAPIAIGLSIVAHSSQTRRLTSDSLRFWVLCQCRRPTVGDSGDGARSTGASRARCPPVHATYRSNMHSCSRRLAGRPRVAAPAARRSRSPFVARRRCRRSGRTHTHAGSLAERGPGTSCQCASLCARCVHGWAAGAVVRLVGAA